MKEISTRSGWKCDTSVKTVTVAAGTTTAVSGVFKNTQCGKLSLQKETNTGKDLSGWKFGVYSDENCTKQVTTLTTKDTGAAVSGNLLPGTYYVKEIPGADSYWDTDTTVQSVTVEAGKTAALAKSFVNTHYGKLSLKKETNIGEDLSGWEFGIFSDENCTDQIATVTTDENGAATSDNLLPGTYWIKELTENEKWFPNTTVQSVTVEAGTVTELQESFVNTKIPNLGTTAMVGEVKEFYATETTTLVDTVSYTDLTPGKEYVMKGILMDKSTGKPFTVDGNEITAETTFTPEEKDGSTTVEFTFDGRKIKTATSIVVFETLYQDEIEIAAHADLEDEGQTVTVYVPGIKTTATVNGEKTVNVTESIKISDVVDYTNLTPGKEYKIKGILMDKSTGKPFTVNGSEITAETTFTAAEKDGSATVEFAFDGSGITKTTKLVVFETLYREDAEIAVHADLEDNGQTVTVVVPHIPQTGDDFHIMLWTALCAAALCGMTVLLFFRKKQRG